MDNAPTAQPGTEKAIFFAALEKATRAEQDAYLDGVCGQDSALRRRVQLLLDQHYEQDSFMNGAAVDHAPTIRAGPGVTETPGSVIGRYKLLQQIGEGGCGVVYMAEQEEPLRRRVALKVIKLGMDTKQVIGRFEAERQALAMMDHPNIAKVLDAGATETGRPYFVMELVRGIKITDYCDQNHLSTRQRLELFVRVCHAIQHAHQKGIIHRDIKPSNILVTVNDGVPVPKVIDFGIAKATSQQRLTDKTLFTAFEQFIGTPAYMSPEQAEMTNLDIDTRSDVYALGVLLYELLTGKTPFDAKRLLAAGLDEMRRIIREQEPARPSTRLSTMLDAERTEVAKHRHADPPRLVHFVRGDLDWIVMKCLEKDRTRRYETANGLASDIERHMEHETVAARPPSTIYRAQKFVRRNKLMVMAGAAVTLTLALGVVVSTWLAFRERHQRERAEESEQRALQAQAQETRQRRAAEEAQRKAETEELSGRQQAYAADMKEVQRALEDGELGLARELLNKYRPSPRARRETGNAESDLRGWEWRYFWSRCQSEERYTLCRYSNSVSALAFSADGKWLAVRRRDDAVALWDAVAKRPSVELPAQGQRWCRALAFSPRGNLLAWSSKDASGMPVVGLWDVTAQKAIAALPHSAVVASVAFAPDTEELAALAYDGTVRVWDLESQQVVSQFLPAAVDTKPDRLSASGKVPATWAAGAGVARPGLESAQSVTRFTTPTIFTGHYGCVRFSPDGRWLAVGEARPQIRLRDRATGREKIIPVPPPAHGITALAFSPDSQSLAAACGAGDSDIHVWDVVAGTRIRLAGHSGGVVDLAFSPDGQTLASASADQSLRLWDVNRQVELRRFQGNGDQVLAVVWSPDGQALVTGAGDGSVRYWDPTAKPAASFAVLPKQIHVWGPAFFPDSKTFLAATRPEGAVVRWDTASLQMVERLSSLGTNHTTLDLARDGRWLALGDARGNVQVWDLLAHRLATNMVFPETEVFALFFSPRGNMLACGAWSVDGRTTGKIWAVAGWREISLAGVSFRNLFEADFSPDEEVLACGYEDGTAAWWDLATKQRQAFFDCRYSSGVHVAFSPDGLLFATAELDGLMTVWDVASCQSQPIGHGYRDWLHDLAFSPDGRRLIASGTGPEGMMKLWDVATGRNVATLPGESGWFCRIGFSPDGNTIFAASKEEGTALFWRAPSFAEIEAAEKAESQASPRAQINPPDMQQPLAPALNER